MFLFLCHTDRQKLPNDGVLIYTIKHIQGLISFHQSDMLSFHGESTIFVERFNMTALISLETIVRHHSK